MDSLFARKLLEDDDEEYSFGPGSISTELAVWVGVLFVVHVPVFTYSCMTSNDLRSCGFNAIALTLLSAFFGLLGYGNLGIPGVFLSVGICIILPFFLGLCCCFDWTKDRSIVCCKRKRGRPSRPVQAETGEEGIELSSEQRQRRVEPLTVAVTRANYNNEFFSGTPSRANLQSCLLSTHVVQEGDVSFEWVPSPSEEQSPAVFRRADSFRFNHPKSDLVLPTGSDDVVGSMETATGGKVEPRGQVQDGDEEDQRFTCNICLSHYIVGETICWSMNPDCHHGFHKKCVMGWLLHENTVCPGGCKQEYVGPFPNTYRRVRW